MEIVTYVGIAVVVFVLAGGIYGFIETCQEKFKYNFFTKTAFIAITVAVAFALFGKYLVGSSNSGSTGNFTGLGMLSVSVLIVVAMVYINFKKTNFWYALGGSMMQLVLFGAAGVAVLCLIALYLGIQLLGSMQFGPNSTDEEQEQQDDHVLKTLLNDDANYYASYHCESYN
jgi:lysylphosphatidylglycerol synthetase-like protein (DUF2156 family)